MMAIEELVRDSLRRRAEDVEATPALWREVQRRTARRRWLPGWQYALGGAAAAVLAAAVILPNLDGFPTPQVDDAVTDRGDGGGPEIMGDPGADADTEADTEAGTGDAPPAEVEELPDDPSLPDDDPLRVTAEGRELTFHGPDGPRVLAELDPGDEFVSWAVRPGSGSDDLTVVSLIRDTDGVLGMRWTRLVDGDPDPALEVFGGPYAVGPAAAHVAGPVWSPDGGHVLWVEESGADVTLRSVGWDDGPGTGETASDHAGFGLDVPGGRDLEVRELTERGGDRFVLVLAPADPSLETHEVHVERQADGAISLPPEHLREDGDPDSPRG